MVKWLPLEEIDTTTPLQILDMAVYISHGAYTLWERYEFNYPSPSYEYVVAQIKLFNLLVWQTILKEKSEFKPAKLRLKIDVLLPPGRAEGLGTFIYIYMHA